MQTINSVILNHLRKNKIPVNRIAKQIGYSSAGFYQLLKCSDMKVSTLHKISIALQYNFFEHLMPVSKHSTNEISQLQSENSLLLDKITRLETELSYLREINQLLKNQKP